MANQQQKQKPQTPHVGFEYPTVTFIDIETVRGERTLDQLSERMQKLYLNRYKHEIKFEIDGSLDVAKHYHEKAGFTAEFGRVVCVSLGKFFTENGALKFKIKTVASRDEKELLTSVGIALQASNRLAGHNIKDFDCPFLMRRYMINGMHIPNILNTMGMKTWDIPFDDTMEMWGGSQWKYRVSMDLLAELCGVKSSKDDMDGSMVGDVYYSDDADGLNRIGTYCSGDVITNANLFCKMLEFHPVTPDMIVIQGGQKISPDEKTTV